MLSRSTPLPILRIAPLLMPLLLTLTLATIAPADEPSAEPSLLVLGDDSNSLESVRFLAQEHVEVRRLPPLRQLDDQQAARRVWKLREARLCFLEFQNLDPAACPATFWCHRLSEQNGEFRLIVLHNRACPPHVEGERNERLSVELAKARTICDSLIQILPHQKTRLLERLPLLERDITERAALGPQLASAH
ncbi:MAG: hypothetical protein WD045_07695 [Pirellulaceae bacterium]